MHRRVVTLVLALLLGVFSSARAEAEQPATQEAARARAITLYEESARAYRAGEFDEAARLVLEAYALNPQPVLIYNLARAYEKGGHLEEALREYRRYLIAEPGTSDRGYIERTLDALQRQVDAAVAARERQARAAHAAGQLRQAALIIAGAGVLAVGAGVALGVVATTRHGDAVNDASGQMSASDESSAKTFATAANVSFVAGGVLAGGGLLWVLLGRSPTAPASSQAVHVSPAPGGLVIGGRF